MNLTEKEIIEADPWEDFDEKNRVIFEDTILRAIALREEQSCDTWRTMYSRCCGEDRVCVRTHMHLLGQAGEQFILFARVRNITSEKKLQEELEKSEKRFFYSAELSNSYAWEYDIDTHDMHPCSRCMRDLGLPPLLKNYPAPVFENGTFPRDYETMYRDWHRQLAEGVGSLEAIIPLTPERIPFHVRYTTEFDENGRPLKAYGSATKVVDCPEQNKKQQKE
jgi:PAS domain-containing protein